MALGLVIGFIVAWAFKIGATTGLFVGVLLVVAGAVIGFVVEWLIDEAYRRNRELQRQMGGRADVRLALDTGGQGEGSVGTASQTLADFLRQRDEAPWRTARHWRKIRSGRGLAGIGTGGPGDGSRCCRPA